MQTRTAPRGVCEVFSTRRPSICRDTGINGTYIGFPFLLQRADSEQTRPRLSPVLLWPVKLAGEIGSRGQFSLAFDSDRGGVRVNPAFEGLYGGRGRARWRALADDLLLRSSSTLGDVVDVFGTLAVSGGSDAGATSQDRNVQRSLRKIGFSAARCCSICNFWVSRWSRI